MRLILEECLTIKVARSETVAEDDDAANDPRNRARREALEEAIRNVPPRSG
jgi:hypothetical protein